MNRQEFIRRLELELFKLPKEEVKDAIDYYNEYLDDAGMENEEAALKELGSPSRIATQIKADFAVKQLSTTGAANNSGRQRLSAVWWVILGLFTAPVALPLAVAGGLLAICMLVTVALLVLAALLCAGAFFVSGIVAFLVGIYMLFIDFANGIFAIGIGMAFVGATVLLALGLTLAVKGLIRFTARRMNEKRQIKAGRTEEMDDE